MSESRVKHQVSVEALASAGVSLGDVVWLKALRNSPASRTPAYQNLKAKVMNLVACGSAQSLAPTG